MPITQEQIQQIATNLSKIQLQNPQHTMTRVSELLEYVKILQEVDTTDTVPTINVIPKDNQQLKTDTQASSSLNKDLLHCSPQNIVAQQIAIPSIMK